MNDYATAETRDELVDEYTELHADVKAAGGKLVAQQAAEAFGGHHELHLHTPSDYLNHELMGVLAEHEVDVERMDRGEWAVVER